MKPIEFPESTGVLNAPPGQEEEVLPLPVFRDGRYVISCWGLTSEERARVACGAPIWLWVQGITQVPVILSVDTPFSTVQQHVSAAETGGCSVCALQDTVMREAVERVDTDLRGLAKQCHGDALGEIARTQDELALTRKKVEALDLDDRRRTLRVVTAGMPDGAGNLEGCSACHEPLQPHDPVLLHDDREYMALFCLSCVLKASTALFTAAAAGLRAPNPRAESDSPSTPSSVEDAK